MTVVIPGAFMRHMWSEQTKVPVVAPPLALGTSLTANGE
jgi:hypothetical protein